MRPAEIIQHENPLELMTSILERLHVSGPTRSEDLETLAYLKYFHSRMFAEYEGRLTYLLGLFHKVGEPKDVLSLAYSAFRDAIVEQANQVLTPVQASIRSGILDNKYFSFSTPTSAGKSYLFRQLIRDEEGDIVIVVPSRALIAEYLIAVRSILQDDPGILVLQFIDDINKLATERRVFVVTPERGKDLFRDAEKYEVSLFLFDEAQLSDEKWRGVNFDSFVRRADRAYPDARKVFAHPFIENPEAQLVKHQFEGNAAARSYSFGAVGKIYLGSDDDTGGFTSFSPFVENGHHKRNRCEFPEDAVGKVIAAGGTLLVFVSKSSIYNKSCIEKFGRYVDMCEPITNKKALAIVDRIERLIGAKGKGSDLVELMRRGVVIHHGSVPLPVRYQIEHFTKQGHAKICFSTSTLAQGVNMPFDVVWADNIRFLGSEENKALGLRNLIGRAGRTSKDVDKFDFGFVVVENIRQFIDRLSASLALEEASLIDSDSEELPEDIREDIESIQNETISDEYNLPGTRLERLASEECAKHVALSLDLLFDEGALITGNEYRELPEEHRNEIKGTFRNIFSISLNRDLKTGEKTVLSSAITIFLWHIQGKSFREVIMLRYNYLSKAKLRRELMRALRRGEISENEYDREYRSLEIEYSSIPYQLPNSNLTKSPPSSFGDHLHVSKINFDHLVYDTYDYMDKVISFSLADIFVAAYDSYYQRTGDERAQAMVNYVRYGTNDSKEIWLLRYGFSFEDIELIGGYVVSIDEDGIVFNDAVGDLREEPVWELVERYR
ncbi:DEAD/DEAH box helicase [Geobacter anodireducens]|uniref:Helicase ATP-binding domain-containing protein n=1 Tax=Geobacter soli TaxID=1510391 RepID=A0A0C1TP61_9BACT|nr:DEAD/DEAH box helicase [Geobacter soli]KIE42629.1 hypothetical protein SE37_08315 [Geobacter soli]